MSKEKLARYRIARRLVRDFMPRFAPLGQIVWSSLSGVEPASGADDWLRELALSPDCVEHLPSIVVRDTEQQRLWLIEIATRRRQLTSAWCSSLKGSIPQSPEHLLFLNAFKNRREFGRLLGEDPWDTVAWSADEPDHFVVFDAHAIAHGLAPYKPRAAQ